MSDSDLDEDDDEVLMNWASMFALEVREIVVEKEMTFILFQDVYDDLPLNLNDPGMDVFLFKFTKNCIKDRQGLYLCSTCRRGTRNPIVFIHLRRDGKKRHACAAFVVACSTSPLCEAGGIELRRDFVPTSIDSPVEGTEWVKFTTCKICFVLARDNKRCSACKSQRYCSRQCQLKDWPAHRKVCGKV
jgi:hypothetical protein